MAPLLGRRVEDMEWSGSNEGIDDWIMEDVRKLWERRKPAGK